METIQLFLKYKENAMERHRIFVSVCVCVYNIVIYDEITMKQDHSSGVINL